MFTITVTADGGAAWAALLKQLEQLETKFAGVELLGRRADGVDTSDIVESLIEFDRDFFTPDNAIADTVAARFALEIEKRCQAAIDKNSPEPDDDTLAAAGLIEAMRAYMDAVVERIESQRTARGGAPQQLTPEYERAKQRRWGFTTPIGKASGQLLAALTPGGGAAGKIQLLRR